jgi:hypothetical protein
MTECCSGGIVVVLTLSGQSFQLRDLPIGKFFYSC